MSTNNIVGWIIGIILILLFFYYFYATNPWRDLKADAAAVVPAMTGGSYLLRKFIKHKKKNNKKHK
jgi:nicotinamide riboside transporter PnuC